MNILVVEDDDHVREMLIELLQDEGYQPAEATDGLAALEVLREAEAPPALILLDLMMPRMNGWELRAALTADPHLADIPIILLSARTDIQQHRRALDVAEHLPKPIDFARLLDLVAHYCQRP